MATVQVGMALAVPVKPDILGERLEAFEKVLPVLTALRLCHRFGQGPNVHVTKLPKEIELSIEELIIKSRQRSDSFYSPWRSAFRHFESRCAPVEHACEDGSPLSDQAVEDDVEFCDSCSEEYWEPAKCHNVCNEETTDLCWTCSQKLDAAQCLDTCDAKLSQAKNEYVQSWDNMPLNFEQFDCEKWLAMIDQSTDGGFAKYDKILREHFGLEAFFSTTRIAGEDRDIWPRNRNHRYHRKEELKTTICYLTQAKQLASQKTYSQSDFEVELGIASIPTAQVLSIQQTSPKQTADASKRYPRALNILDIEPYCHPSQRHSIVLPGHGDAMNTLNAKGAAQHDSSSNDMSAVTTWPQLVVLVKSSVDCSLPY